MLILVRHLKTLTKIIQINNVKLSKKNLDQAVFKTNFVVNYMNLINKVLEKSLFLYIERDKLDVGISILRARKIFYGDYNKWWAKYTLNLILKRI